MAVYGKLTMDLTPSPGNPRNSEGAFARLSDGSILFAYSSFCGDSGADDAPSNIAAVISHDNGDSWSAPFPVISAEHFGVTNIMSVSAVELQDGSIGFVYVVKELDGSNTFAVSITQDGTHFTHRRCESKFPHGYYVLNNDRIERLQDGRLILPVAHHRIDFIKYGHRGLWGTGMYLASDDELQSLTMLPPQFIMPEARSKSGIQEPGILEHKNGMLWSYARTDRGWQYECFSNDGLQTVTSAQQSQFSSPCSPMKIKRNPYNGELLSVWNPIPNYNGRKTTTSGRTPLVIARSTDDGRTWEEPVALEDDENRGYCYPALYFVDEKTLLVSYCRGSRQEGRGILSRLGIQKLTIDF